MGDRSRSLSQIPQVSLFLPDISTVMQLQHAEVPVPTPGKEQVLVKVEAAGVNPADWKIQQGVFRPFGPSKMPCIPGKS